ncbi:MAG: hypothetical protein K8T89_04095 [Planctomycetes bacterium]|nr:hypothetical protein [Planctomycetota bacterium]
MKALPKISLAIICLLTAASTLMASVRAAILPCPCAAVKPAAAIEEAPECPPSCCDTSADHPTCCCCAPAKDPSAKPSSTCGTSCPCETPDDAAPPTIATIDAVAVTLWSAMETNSVDHPSHVGSRFRLAQHTATPTDLVISLSRLTC